MPSVLDQLNVIAAAAAAACMYTDGATSLDTSYGMLTVGGNNIKLWDVRKPKPIKSFDFEPEFQATSVHVDYAAVYVAVGGNKGVRVLEAKSLETLVTLQEHKKPVTDVKWLRSNELVSVSLDRALKIYAHQQ
jgi:WD40 repeat protein